MEIIDNKALLITVRQPNKFTDAVKASAYLGEISEGVHEIMVKWDYDNAVALTKLGLKKVPSVIHRDYKWSGKFIPMAHQKETAGFIINNQRCFVFNEQGVGKTASAAWAVDYLMKLGKAKRALVICPLSIMRPAWQRDLFQVLPHRSVGIAHGTAKARRDVIQGNYEFVIINFDGIEIVLQDLVDAKFDCIIVDEANALKSTQTRRWKAFKHLITPDARIILMTGTPAAQSPEDAYGLAKIVSPHNVPTFYSGWKELVMQKISTFKWIPRPRAKDIVFRALQPAIRFTKEECLDLPDITYETREVPLTPQQDKYYQVLRKQLLIEAAGESVSAVNAAAKLNKLLQISCITGDTKVLSNSGWKRLDSVNLTDLIWDGEEWVTHSGLVYQGIKEVVTLDGVRMTSDHKVLTASGWHSAGEINNGGQSKKFNRTKVWIPNSYQSCRNNTEHLNTMRPMGVPMHLWGGNNTSQSVSTHQTQNAPAQLWVSSWKRNAQNVVHTSIQNMDRYATQMLRLAGQRLQKLWWPGDNYMRPVGKFLRAILAGYAINLRQAFNFGPNRCKPQLHTTKLSLGYCTGTILQHEIQPTNRNSTGYDDIYQCFTSVQHKEKYSVCSNNEIRMGCREIAYDTSEAVYDIVNCGPRNRFVVQNGNGDPFIVHNCGAVYSDDGTTLYFDISNRLSELEAVIDESLKKVIVFAPFTHTIEVIEQYLTKKKISCAVINGAVSANKRTLHIQNFQDNPDPRVLIIQPQAAAHGITLTAANTIVWFGPTSSVETYLQANARAHRKGQDHKVTVIMIQGSPAESHMYTMLNSKVDSHQQIIDLYNNILAD